MLDQTFKKFCQEIDFQIPNELLGAQVIEVSQKNSFFVVSLLLQELIPIDIFKKFYYKIRNANIKFDLKISYFDTSKKQHFVKDYFEYAYLLASSNFWPLENRKIEFSQEGIYKIFIYTELEKDDSYNNIIKNYMQNWGFINFEIEYILDKEWEKETNKKREELIQLEKKREKTIKEETIKSISSQKKDFTFYEKSKSYIEMNIKDALETEEYNVSVSGEIFKKDIQKTKTDLWIVTLTITDYQEAIKVKIFAKTLEEKEIQEGFVPKKYITVYGNCVKDDYTRSKIIRAKKVELIEVNKIQRQDLETNKRVELYARTNMSAMDGISSAKEYIEEIARLKHTSLGIADLDSAQAFPDLFHEAKKHGIKAIYGTTFKAIEYNNNAILNPIKNIELKNARYIVFDLETTGFSPIYNEIIEFGCVVIENGKVINSHQFFIKPTKPLPRKIIELTKITEKDVENAISQEEGIKKIYDILKNSIAVAHNSNFDIGFVNEKINFFGLPKLNIMTIDTLVVSWILSPEAKRFRMENIATRAGINYDPTIAHRADYDADVLAKVWLNYLLELENKNIKTTFDLRDYEDDKLHSKKFSNEVVIYAKNQEGLKELFKIISKSSTETFYNAPKIFFDKFQKSENLLIASGTLNSILIQKAFYSTNEIIEQEIEKYDVVFIPPIRDFIHWIRREKILEEDIKKGLINLVNLAKKKNIPVVAVSDCRYIEENQKTLHEIYINAKGLGGVRHYLFDYEDKNPKYPLQNFLTTEEMYKEFSFLGDFNLIKEVVVTNSNKIASEFEYIEVIKDKLYAPIFDNSRENLEKLVYKTAKEKYGEVLPKIVKERIEKELNPILKHGFDVIYWISHKLVAKSLNDGYLVGSRGSVGSSLVATMAGITEVNPLKPHYICKQCKYSEFFEDEEYLSGFDLEDKECENCKIPLDKDGHNIPFETFLGFDADKVPDIDLNFSGDYQNIIHKEVRDVFGEEHTFRAGTISTNKEKTVFGYLRDQIERGLGNYSSNFMEFLAHKAEGVKRTTGQHPGGIIIIPKEFEIEDFTPINFPANNDSSSWKTTHFDFHSIHDNVLKLDLLGHDDPTAIKMLETLTNIKAQDIPKSDPKIISLFSSTEALGITPEDISGETTGAMGIPEFGTNFVRQMLKTATVKSFADLVVISGLSHGEAVWKGNAEDLIVNNNLNFKDVVSCRDNIMGFLIQKGIEPLKSFKIMEQVRKGKSITKEEETLLTSHNVPDWYIDSLKKIRYLFPKAHATAYVIMAWRIAYFKLYHPLAYYATYFTTRADFSDIETLVAGKDSITEKIRELKAREFAKNKESQLSAKEKSLIPILSIAEEMYARGFSISNIDIMKSKATQWILDHSNKTLIPPFITIDGLGEAVATSIETARAEGNFSSIEDLKNRTSLNKTILKKIKDLGILNHLNETDQKTLF
ncbi:PolC-type DNA polymerase III [Mesomycoplasma molare]|uniref:DNA polymerase III PolC-type n=1 Tax=Mesomycoplasma molare TaxID=171288 RepID=A0ABY5TUK8_9BACT|nr:PolC-type DNA polymerase III [Mesomycoplasma molare]UWD34337.1 PolC-type DNA polymerase III [Mesomycoplasma molare]